MISLRRIIIHIANGVFGRKWLLVALRDFDGKSVARIAKPDAWGTLYAERQGMGVHPVSLNSDGTIKDHRGYEYVKEWKKI